LKAEVLPGEEPQEQPIDLLVSLAEEGEIDPWDVDLVRVTDRFLEAVNAIDRRGLKVCGETLLYASIMLRMKSEALLEEEDEEKEHYHEEQHWEPAPINPLWDEPPELDPPARREAPRPATLDELIDELQNAARRVKLREERMEGRDEEERRTQEQVKELPHKEHMEDRVEEFSDRLRDLFSSRDSITFDSLLQKEDSANSKLDLFLPLLFMDARNLVDLDQGQLFDDINIYPRNDLWESDEEDN